MVLKLDDANKNNYFFKKRLRILIAYELDHVSWDLQVLIVQQLTVKLVTISIESLYQTTYFVGPFFIDL